MRLIFNIFFAHVGHVLIFRNLVRHIRLKACHGIFSQNALAVGTHRVASNLLRSSIDRLFAGVEFREVTEDILLVSALNDQIAAEIEDKYALYISIIASEQTNRIRDGAAEDGGVDKVATEAALFLYSCDFVHPAAPYGRLHRVV